MGGNHMEYLMQRQREDDPYLAGHWFLDLTLTESNSGTTQKLPILELTL